MCAWARDGCSRGRIWPGLKIGSSVGAREVVNTHVNIFTLIVTNARLVRARAFKTLCVSYVITTVLINTIPNKRILSERIFMSYLDFRWNRRFTRRCDGLLNKGVRCSWCLEGSFGCYNPVLKVACCNQEGVEGESAELNRPLFINFTLDSFLKGAYQVINSFKPLGGICVQVFDLEPLNFLEALSITVKALGVSNAVCLRAMSNTSSLNSLNESKSYFELACAGRWSCVVRVFPN